MSVKVTLYSRNVCPACHATDRLLKPASAEGGFEYENINVEAPGNEHLAPWLVDEGYRAMPVVHVSKDGVDVYEWVGIGPDKSNPRPFITERINKVRELVNTP